MKYTKDILAVIIILAAVGSLFYTVNEVGAEFLRGLGALVIGYYFGAKQVPIMGAIQNAKKNR